MILGLDISTTAIGYSIISKNNIIKIGIIKPLGEDLFIKCNDALNKIYKILKLYPSIKYISIEDSLKSFAAGKTKSDVKIKLITINNIIYFELWKLQKYKIFKFHPSAARKLVIGKANDKKRNFKKPTSKRYAMYFLIKKYGKDFYNSLPRLKTKDRLDKTSFDISDSLIISLAAQKNLK